MWQGFCPKSEAWHFIFQEFKYHNAPSFISSAPTLPGSLFKAVKTGFTTISFLIWWDVPFPKDYQIAREVGKLALIASSKRASASARLWETVTIQLFCNCTLLGPLNLYSGLAYRTMSHSKTRKRRHVTSYLRAQFEITRSHLTEFQTYRSNQTLPAVVHRPIRRGSITFYVYRRRRSGTRVPSPASLSLSLSISSIEKPLPKSYESQPY